MAALSLEERVAALEAEVAGLKRDPARAPGDENGAREISTEHRLAPEEAESERIVREVRQALASGDHLGARQLAQAGATAHSDSDELRRMASVLARPKVLRNDLPANPSIIQNHRWLRESSAAYKGRWVAVKDGRLLGAAATLRELKQQHDVPEGSLLTKVV